MFKTTGISLFRLNNVGEDLHKAKIDFLGEFKERGKQKSGPKFSDREVKA
jgi:hypothetical protein